MNKSAPHPYTHFTRRRRHQDRWRSRRQSSDTVRINTMIVHHQLSNTHCSFRAPRRRFLKGSRSLRIKRAPKFLDRSARLFRSIRSSAAYYRPGRQIIICSNGSYYFSRVALSLQIGLINGMGRSLNGIMSLLTLPKAID